MKNKPAIPSPALKLTDRLGRLGALALFTILSGCAVSQNGSTSQAALVAEARQAAHQLIAENPAAAVVNHRAVAVLVFPSVIKGGFLIGGQSGNGVLFVHGRAVGIYNTSAASYGLQAGIQNYGYALFFMNHQALAYLDKSGGFELGLGPSVVVADQGFAKNYTSTTLTQDVYAFVFDQKGVMAGLGVTGSKITRLSP